VNVVPLKRYTVGGSECAAAAGIDPHRSRVWLWGEKTGRPEFQRPESEAMRWGKLLQPVVVAELEARGYRTIGEPYTFADAARPWAKGTPDGQVELGGDWSVLEIKTMGQWAARQNGDAIPLAYAAQCQWYMHLMGCDRALLATLIGGQKLDLHAIERSQGAIDHLLALAEEFLGYCERDEQPPPPEHDQARDSTREAIHLLNPTATEGRVYRLTRAEYDDVKALRDLRKMEDACKHQRTELENRLKAAMGDAETAISPNDDEAIRWPNVTARRLDQTRVKDERPDVFEAFAAVTTSRRFTLT
jgi:putative phage-type endonuclease